MALQNNPYLFTGGAVRLDSNPYTNFQINAMARKQAKDESLEEYYRNLTKGINPAGVRTQDLPEFDKKVSAMREFYDKNREAIKYPMKYGGAAQTQYQQLYQDALNHVQASKYEEEKKKPLIDLLTDPNKRDRVPDQVLMDLHLHDLPLNDKSRKSFDIASLQFDPKPVNWDTYLKGYEDIKMSQQAPTVVTDPKTMMKTISTTSAYDDLAKQTIYNRAVQAYQSDPSMKHFTEKELDTPANYQRLNPAFKKAYGRDMAHYEDFLAAATLEGLQPSKVEQKVEDDVFARQKAMEAIRFGNDKELIRFRKSIDPNDTELNNLWVDKYIEQIVGNARSDKTKRTDYKFANGKNISGYRVEIDPTLEKALGFTSKEPGQLVVTDDGKFIRSFYETAYDNKTGEYLPTKKDGKHVFEPSRTGELSQDQIKLALGKRSITPTQLNKEMIGTKSPNKSSYNIKGKNYSEAELLKMGYTIDQIAPFKQ